MEITVNQQNYIVSDNCALQQVLTDVIGISEKGIAIAINQEIVARSDWHTFQLKPGDKIIIIKATQGG